MSEKPFFLGHETVSNHGTSSGIIPRFFNQPLDIAETALGKKDADDKFGPFLTKNIPFYMPVGSVLSNSREVKLLLDVMRFATGRYNQFQPYEKTTLVFNMMSFPHCYVPNASLRPLCDELAGTPIEQWLEVVKKIEKFIKDFN